MPPEEAKTPEEENAATLAQQEADEAAAEEAAFDEAFASDDVDPEPKVSGDRAEEQTSEEGELSEGEDGGKQQAAEEAGDLDKGQQKEDPAPDPVALLEEKLSKRLRNVEGKYGQLNGNMTQLMSALKDANNAATQQNVDKPTKDQVQEALGSGEKFAELKKEFPEWAEAMEESLTSMQEVIASKIPKFDPKALESQVQTLTRAQVAEMRNQLKEELRVDMKHPDWQETVNTEDFQKWMSEQPEDIQELALSDKAADAIKMLDSFVEFKTASQHRESDKQQQQQVRQTQTKRLEDAVAPTNGGGSQQKSQVTTEEDDFLAAFKSA